MTKFLSKIAGMAEPAGDTDFCNAAVRIPQFMGRLLQPVKGKIFQRGLPCDLLKAAKTLTAELSQ